MNELEKSFFESPKISTANKAIIKNYFEDGLFKHYFLTIWKEIKNTQKPVGFINETIPELDELSDLDRFLRISQVVYIHDPFSENHFC